MNGWFPLVSEPDDIAARFRELPLPLTSVRASRMFHKVWIYFTENGSVVLTEGEYKTLEIAEALQKAEPKRKFAVIGLQGMNDQAIKICRRLGIRVYFDRASQIAGCGGLDRAIIAVFPVKVIG